MIDDGQSQKRVKSRKRCHYIWPFFKGSKAKFMEHLKILHTWELVVTVIFPEKFIFMPYRMYCALLGWPMFAWCHFLPLPEFCVFSGIWICSNVLCVFLSLYFWSVEKQLAVDSASSDCQVLTVPPIWSPIVLRYVNHGKREWICGNCKRD